MIAGCIVLLAVLGVCTYGFILKGSDTIFPNVYVAGVNVGGLKRDAAINAVTLAVEQETATDTLTVVLPDRTIDFTPEITNVALNPDEAADAAMNYGRDGGPITALLTYERAKKTRQDISLESGTNLDTAYIRDLIDQTARACASEKVDPTVTVDADAKTVTVVTGSPKISLDADALYDAVVARFNAGDLSELKFDYDTEPLRAGRSPAVLRPVRNRDEGRVLRRGKRRSWLPKRSASASTCRITRSSSPWPIPARKSSFRPRKFSRRSRWPSWRRNTSPMYSVPATAPHTAQAGRTKNLELACKAIDGTILNPGDEFSFNKIVGERTPEKGYQSAIVYQTGGKSEAEAGGGVCQVASTIYTACLYADLKVTERSPHMFTVTYVQLGMDATIYWGSLDYKFVNSTDHPLRIDASVSGGYVHVKLVGTAPKDKGYDHIVLRHEVVATVQPKMEIDGDKTIITDAGTALDENGNTVNIVVDKDGNKYIKGDMVQYSYVGKTVMAYRDYVDANGTVIKTETLHKDTYQARNTSYKCTPYVEPEVPEEPDPTDPGLPDYP